MNDQKHNHSHANHQNSGGHRKGPYWSRAHHDWKFWVALVLALAAITVYFVSDDLAFRPKLQEQKQVP